MASSEQIDSVRASIERIETERFLPEDGQMMPSDAPDAVPWDDLPEEQQLDVLALSVDWSGFTTEEQLDVSTRVIEGESSEFWFDETPASDAREVFASLAAEIREDEQAARVRDYGPEIDKYEVWHADRPRESGEPQLDFPEAYTKAAEVWATNPGEAVALTTHVDHPWQENPGVEAEDGYRSTLIGDVIVDPQGQAHRFEEQGFHLIGRDASAYDRLLQDAAERGYSHANDNDKGMDR